MKKTHCHLKKYCVAFSMMFPIFLGTAQQGNTTSASSNKQYSQTINLEKSKQDNPQARRDYHLQKIINPLTGKLPEDIYQKEIAFSKQIPEGKVFSKSIKNQAKSGNNEYYYWKQRGPSNVGGRTRALAVDRTDENIILAGGVTGGLWRSENSGKTWSQITGFYNSPMITSIVQDPRQGKEHIWYYGGGETQGSTGDSGNRHARGDGLYKSIDGGRSFEALPASVNTTTDLAKDEFAFINRLVVDPTTGDLYIASSIGVYRWEEGKNSFETIRAVEPLMDLESSGYDVAISPTGKVYAAYYGDRTFFQNPDQPFFFLSEDQGKTWKNLTPPDEMTKAHYGRAVIEIDPSDEHRIYLFVSTLLESYNGANVYRYQAQEKEKPWTDLSGNLLVTNDFLNSISIFGGYNMVFEVHPKNPNIIFIGGANLFRSTTGLTTPLEKKDKIGGYCSETGIEYHHADQHALWFYKSNINKMLSANDGGIYITQNLMGTGCDELQWVSLNSNYITTQPYHVSFDPDSTKDELLTGLQDNGSWYSDNVNLDHPWEFIHHSDGGYSAIADQGKTRYVSTQNGIVTRYQYDDQGTLNPNRTNVSPEGVVNPAFITPYMLDPINDNMMYYLGGKTIWRNNNLDGIPSGGENATSVNWHPLDLDLSETPSAMGLSQYPVANRMYFGTTGGTIYRLDHANIGSDKNVDISSGKGLPKGYISDITVDPSNSDRVIVTYSNYGIQSLFLTEDGGETWTDIGGNLEEKPDGTGKGPSIKAASFLGSSRQSFFGTNLQTVFVATSTGLYYTNNLQGKDTYWYKEPYVVGHALTTTVATRKDGFIAVSSHGNGIFSAKFPILFNPLPELSIRVNQMLDDIEVDFREDYSYTIDVSKVFKTTDGGLPEVTIINSNPEFVSTSLQGQTLKVSYKGNTGVNSANIGLVAKKGEEQISEGFTFSTTEPILYEQKLRDFVSRLISCSNEHGFSAQSADDFTIPKGETWDIRRVLAFTFESESITTAENDDILSAKVQFYKDLNGKPGEFIKEFEITDLLFFGKNISITLPTLLSLNEGTYWMSIVPAIKKENTYWIWDANVVFSFGDGSNNIIGAPAHYLGDNIYPDQPEITNWTPTSEIELYSQYKQKSDARFQLFGSKKGDNSDIRLEQSTNSLYYYGQILLLIFVLLILVTLRI